VAAVNNIEVSLPAIGQRPDTGIARGRRGDPLRAAGFRNRIRVVFKDEIVTL